METQTTQNPIPEPVQPANQIPAKSNNFLIVTLSVLLLIAVSIAFFFALQTQKLAKQLAQYQSVTPSPSPMATPDETANSSRDEVLRDWKKYEIPEWNITFEYPPHFMVQKYPGPHFVIIWQYEGTLARRPLLIFETDLQSGENNVKKFLELEVGESYKYEVEVTGFFQTTTRVKNIQINGIQALVFDTPEVWEAEGPHRTVLIPKDQKTYRIDMAYSNISNRDIDYPKIFTQILSTFKFLD